MKRPRGRPPKQGGTMKQISIRIPVELLETATAIAEQQSGTTDTTPILREWLVAGMKADKRVGEKIA